MTSIPILICLSAIFFLPWAVSVRHFDGMDFFRADSRVTPAPRCIAARPCILNAGCAGVGKGFQPKKPWCAGGVLVGKCDCTACVGGIPCNNDSKCGGLIGACNNKTKTCDCLKAAQMHYDAADPIQKAQFPTLGASIASFCAKENCLNSTVGCYGLPCKKGFCVCP